MIRLDRIGFQWRAKLGPFEVSAKTKTKAKADLLALIAAEPEVYEPFVLKSVRGHSWFLWREPGTWVYRTPSGGMTLLGGSRNEAINTMIAHAQSYPEVAS